MSRPGLFVEFREFKVEENGTTSGLTASCMWIQVTNYQNQRMAIPASRETLRDELLQIVSGSAPLNQDVFAVIPTVDGREISIPYSRPDQEEYMEEKATHFRLKAFDQGSVDVGSKAIIPNWEWVDVMNDSPITQRFSNGSQQLPHRSTCGIEMGGTVTVQEIRGNDLLVKYKAPSSPLGTPCPTGTLFIVDKAEFLTFTMRYITKRNSIIEEQRLVKQMLSEDFYGETTEMGSWTWVDVVNIEPIRQSFSNGHSYLAYGDTCGAGQSSSQEKSGTIQVRGEANGKILYEYTAYGNPKGTPCPSGVLFFMSKSERDNVIARYRERRQRAIEEKRIVEELLAQDIRGKTMDAGEWSWVDVVNIEPVRQNFSNGYGSLSYGGTCGIGRSDYGNGRVNPGGTIQARGEAFGKTLYEYIANGDPVGTPCPSGVLFFR